MNIYFKSKKIEKLCNSEKEIRKRFSSKIAEKIMERLQSLEAAKNLSDIPTGPPERRHVLKGADKGTISINLDEKQRLLFKPLPEECANLYLPDGGYNYCSITSIEIWDIRDTHE